jgi:zinc and cadmium transporter
MNFWNDLTLYSGMISASVLAGGIVPLFFVWTRKQLHLLLSFSAGLMLGATLIHLLPSSFELIGKNASVWVLAGFLFLYIFEKFITLHICEVFECEVHSMGISAVVGISAHALTDGVALGSGLLVSGLGFIVFLTIFFHKLPEAFALTTILLHESKQSRGRIIFFNLLLIAMVPLGALLVHFLIGAENLRFAGIALAFSAGTFLHISLSDLLPHVHEHAERRLPIAFAFLAGLAAMFFLEKFLEHGGHHHI